MVCATARTGSTWLGHELAYRGYGVPDEYLNPNFVGRVKDVDRHLAEVVARRTGPTGVFAIEVFPWHLGSASIDVKQLLDKLPGEKRVVWLRRRDKAAQAVSLHFAQTTGVWQYEHIDPSRPPPPYSAGRINAALSRVRRQEDKIAEMLSGIETLLVDYEDMRQDMTRIVLRIGGFLGVQPSNTDAQFPAMTTGLGALKRAYLEKFRKDPEADA